MAHKLISSGSPYEVPIGFSRAVRVGNVIAVAGTAPIAEDGSTFAPGKPYEQARKCLEIIKKAIEAAGGESAHVIRTRIYLTDMSIWEEVGRAHGEFFNNIKPASTLVEVKGLARSDWLVEIEADCIIED
jgi:enamine deaminase RidA (YjgF/YER057c/UK114 family)